MDNFISPPKSEVRSSVKPPLSIVHLMVWTATSAIMMALVRIPPATVANEPVALIFLAAIAMYGGAAIGGVIMWAVRRRRSVPFLTEPGEWMLLIQGECVIYFTLVYYLVRYLPSTTWSYGGWLMGLLLYVAFGAIGTAPALQNAGGDHDAWKLFFVLLAALIWALPVAMVAPPLIILEGIIVVAATFTFVFAFGADISGREKRGWVHWLGTISMVVFGIGFLYLGIAILIALYAN